MMATHPPLFAMHSHAPDARVGRISEVQIQVRSALLRGDLAVPPGARGIVLFEEPGTRQQVAGMAGEWLEWHLARHPNKRIRQKERDSHVVR